VHGVRNLHTYIPYETPSLQWQWPHPLHSISALLMQRLVPFVPPGQHILQVGDALRPGHVLSTQRIVGRQQLLNLRQNGRAQNSIIRLLCMCSIQMVSRQLSGCSVHEAHPSRQICSDKRMLRCPQGVVLKGHCLVPAWLRRRPPVCVQPTDCVDPPQPAGHDKLIEHKACSACCVTCHLLSVKVAVLWGCCDADRDGMRCADPACLVAWLRIVPSPGPWLFSAAQQRFGEQNEPIP
jgi:hypothetical protein